MRPILAAAMLIACMCEARAQAGDASPPLPARTLASLLAEGYEMQRIRVFKDTIWLRKPGGGGLIAYICDRGRIGSAAFDAYRNHQYDQISCLPAP
jgi:hypothetical protein